MITDEAFEKWSLDQKTEFVLAFKKACNEAYGTAYELTEESLKENQDFDFSLEQKDGKILKVQHTFAGAEAEKEYIRPKNTWAVISAVKEQLKDLKGLFVSINLHNPPQSEAERKKLVFWLEHIIQEKAKESPHPFLFSYDERDEHYLKHLRQWVDRLEIMVADLPNVVFGYGNWRLGDSAVLSDDIRVDIALRHKEENYSNPEDLVIVVHFNKMPFFDFYLSAVKDQQADRLFRGIWLYDGWSERFIKIK